MDAAAEIGRNPVSKYQIQPRYGDEQADAGRDCRTRLARPNSQARMGTGKNIRYHFPCSADHEQDWQPCPVDPYPCLAIICHGHTCIPVHIISHQANYKLQIDKAGSGGGGGRSDVTHSFVGQGRGEYIISQSSCYRGMSFGPISAKSHQHQCI